MKKIFIYLTILLSTNIFAQTQTIEQPRPSKLASTMNRVFNYQPGPDLKKGAQKVLQATPKQAAKAVGGYVVTNKGKSIVGVAAVGSVVTYNHLIDNPEKMERYFSKHPEMLENFTKYVDYRLENAKTQKEYDTFLNVKEKLALDQNINESQSTAIYNDPVYQQIESEVRQRIAQATIIINNSATMPSCSMNIVSQLLNNTDIFSEGFGMTLPSIQNTPTQILNVNTYIDLKNKYSVALATEKLTPDHIPSYGALSIYFKKHGFTLPKRNGSNLEANSSSIAIPTKLHQIGSRTYGGRNNKKDLNGEKTMEKDAENLLEATILDISIFAYLFYQNPQYRVTPEDYINRSLILFERNKLLCLYDIK